MLCNEKVLRMRQNVYKFEFRNQTHCPNIMDPLVKFSLEIGSYIENCSRVY